MIAIQCFQCAQPIYRLLQPPRPGLPVLAHHVAPLVEGLARAPQPQEAMRCPMCGRFPFVMQNTGLQMLTVDGQLIPD
jgi:hypothetical protein